MRLPTSFYRRDATTVARALIGCVLVNGARAGIIVETEAYHGPEDLASHARFGRGDGTARTSVMFGPGGISYVYLCYGIHEMFNIVTGEAGDGQAVLIRAIAPHLGLPDDPAIGRGPGKVTTALAIDRRLDRKNLARGPLFVAPGPEPAPPITSGPRIGVAYAGAWAGRPFRFWWADHPSVSRGAAAPSASPAPSLAPSRTTVSTRRKR
ncbi:MAG: DNA-3-methyladenine glycosylase [Deltaproteobacteria bacterium]|nr:DNA-3-methyladenine glycosylase [Deltaproteobacteria bacterium]